MHTVAPVGIIGAGPVGMVCALRLASLGIRSVLLDAKPALVKQGSKACLIQGDVVEILDKIACGERMRDEGVRWNVGRTYVRSKVIATKTFPLDLGFGPFINISQHRLEQVMLGEIEANPLCEILWSCRVNEIAQDAESVRIVAESDGAREEHAFQYLIACDGVNSSLRGMVGAELDGYTHNARFLITDIKAKLPLHKGRHFYYDPAFNPGRQVVIHPQPDDIWRIDWQLAPEDDIEAEKLNGKLDRRIRAVIGDIDYEIDWLSTYRFHQRVLRNFRHGRVFFAGDAAHSFPPYGSRGMNSGIQDADNLIWKMALVLKGEAGDALLDTYHTERHAAAVENLRITEDTLKFMVPPNRYRRYMRNTILHLARLMPAMRRFVNSGKMAEPYVYAKSPIVAAGHVLSGKLAPDAMVCEQGVEARLRKYFGRAFTCVYFAKDAEDAKAFAARQEQTANVPHASIIVILPPAQEVQSIAPDTRILTSNDPDLAQHYGCHRGEWILVRMDGHVAGHGTHADRVRDAVRNALEPGARSVRKTEEPSDQQIRRAA
ncbi:FAD-dependent monooxygenase [Lysobacter brunescens]|uniref:FAD-dependent monooxygenase n=1 Tax=Lysobacter brunescens TaxID=262323 RepID=A0A6B7LHS5_9GAMM|nr:putative kynurenine hydroxylase [Lysobacter brunescens]